MKTKHRKLTILLFLLSCLMISEGITLLSNFTNTSNNDSPIYEQNVNSSANNYYFIDGITVTGYSFDAKFECYIITELSGIDSTTFELDTKIYDVSYGLNIIPIDFGNSSALHSLNFEQNDVDDQNFNWFAVQPLLIEQNETIVSIDDTFTTSFFASGTVAILVQPSFSYNWLYLELDGIVINDVYDPNFYPEIDSTLFSYFIEDGSYLSFIFHLEPQEHVLKIRGNGSLNYKIISNYDWDEDLIYDVEEVQKELFHEKLNPTIPNVWGYFGKSDEIAQFDDISGIAKGCFHFYIPESYNGARYLYIFSNRGTISDIVIDDDFLTLEGITLSKENKYTPYGYLAEGHHTLNYRYFFNETTEIKMQIGGREIIILDKMEYKDTDGDGVKDNQERSMGSDKDLIDTDFDGLQDNIDSSPLTSMILDKDEYQDFYIPANIDKNTVVTMRIKKPNQDYTALEERIYLDNHYHGPGINVTIFPVIEVYGNYSGLFDPVPDLEDLNASKMYIYAEITDDAFEFKLSYGKGHPGKEDGEIDLRFFFRWMVFYNDSGSTNFLRQYNFEQDILVQSMIVEEVGDANYILGTPDSMIEHQILWTLTQNPMLGTPSDFDVNNDIVGIGTMDYLEIANQTCIDYKNAQLNENETVVLYVAGVQNNYDFLNKISLESIANPSFEVNHSGQFGSYSTFCSINDPNKKKSDFQQFLSKKCYEILWNNLSTETTNLYEQRANLQGFPIKMQTFLLQDSRILKLTQAIGTQVPLSDIPFTLEPTINEKIALLNQTYLEPIEGDQISPELLFNESKHILYETLDTRQMNVAVSELIFEAESIPLSEKFANFLDRFKIMSEGLENTINLFPELGVNLDFEILWDEKISLYERFIGIDIFFDQICTRFTPEDYNIFEAIMDDVSGLDDVLGFAEGIEELIEPTVSIEHLKSFGTTSHDLARFFKTKQVGLGLFSTFLGYYQIIIQIRDMYEIFTNLEDYDLVNFTSAMGIALGNTVLGVLALANGGVSIALAFSSYAVSETLLSMAGTLAVVSAVVYLAVEAFTSITKIYNEYKDHGLKGAIIEFRNVLFESAFPLFSYKTLSTLVETNRFELLAFYLITPYFANLIISFFLQEPPQTIVLIPSLEIVWEDPEGDPATFIIYPIRDTWYGNSLTDGDFLEFQITFHNNGTLDLMVVDYIAIPSSDGTVVYEWGELFGVNVGETGVGNHLLGIGVFSPNLMVSWNLQILLTNYTVIYNEVIEIQCGMPVCPDNIADFYTLTENINKTYNEHEKFIKINDHATLELDPAIGVVPINLSLDMEGYDDNMVTFNISCEDTNFYVDTPTILQNLYSNINFNLYSQDFNYLGGIYYFTLEIINGTGVTIFSEEVSFRLSFMRDLSYSQTNTIFEEKLNKVLDWSNVSTLINVTATSVEIGHVMFAKFITNSTKKMNISLLFDTQIMASYQIKARGKFDDFTHFVEILIDKDFTFNNFYLEGVLSNTDYLMITDLIIIDASIKTTSDIIFNPINFTNNGNVPEFVEFSFSGINFDNVDTTLYQNEFEGINQYAIIIEGEVRTCLFNISIPVNIISNLYYRSITASETIFKRTYCKHIDNLEIEGIYINNPINTTHNQYLREDTLMISIIPQEDLEWTSYSLDDQPNVNFSHSVYIPFPQEGTHKIQVFGENSFSELFESEIRYFTVKSMMIDIKSPVSEFYSKPDLGYIYNASYGFDYDLNGSKPVGLESTENVNIINYMDDHIKVAELGTNYEHLSCLEGETRAYGTIEFWIRFGDFEHSSYTIAFSDSFTDDFLIFISTSDDTWHYYPDYQTSLQIPNVANPQINTWHHVRIDFRCNGAPAYLGLSEEYFTINIDGISSGPLDFYYTGFNDVGSIKIGTSQYNAKEGKLWIDAIGCSWDTEYTIGDNLGGIKRYAIPLIYDSEVYYKSINYIIDHDYSTPLKTKDLAFFSENGSQTYELIGMDIFGDPYESNLLNLAVNNVNLITPSGTNILINDPFTGISLNFTNIVTSGTTTISLLTNETTPAFPSTFEINSHYYPTYILSTQFYELTSSAEFYDPMTITFPYPENRVQHNERNIELFRYEYGWWHNITHNLNLDQNEISGIISSLSYFVVIEIIDDLTPQTHLLINGSYPKQNSEYTNDLFIELNVYEDFRVTETLYSIDSINWILYTGPFVLDEEFNSHLEYYSIDDSNNSEPIDWRGVLLDKFPPVTEIMINPNRTDSSGNIYYLDESTISFIVNDVSFVGTYYLIENTHYTDFRGYTEPIEIPDTGTWTIHFYSRDQVGHEEEIKTISISNYNNLADFLPIIIGSSIAGTAGVAVLLTILFLRKRRIKSPTKT